MNDHSPGTETSQTLQPQQVSLHPKSWDTSNGIKPHHHQEWEESCVAEDIIRINVESLKGSVALDVVCGAKLEGMGGHAQQYVTKQVEGLLTRYAHVAEGGWWVSGLDPLNGWKRMTWGQFKPDKPRPNPEKPEKAIKYETPVGTEARAIFLDTGDLNFWPSVLADPSKPIVLVEGAKKAGCIMSLGPGFGAIALPGVWMGTRKDKESGDHELIKELALFAAPGRKVIICFDEDSSARTRSKVSQARDRLASELADRGCLVSIPSWHSSDGKGFDDVVAAKGTEYGKQILANATPWAPPTKTYAQVVHERLYGGDWACINGTLHRFTGTHYEKRDDAIEEGRIAAFLAEYRTKKGFEHASAKKAEAALAWVKQRTAIAPDTVNPVGVFNLINGVLVINWSNGVPTWELEPHGRHKFTYAPLYRFDPDCDPTACDALLSALNPGEREIMLKVMAAAIDLPSVRKVLGREVKSLMLWGFGNNGKDSLREAFAGVFGGQRLTGCSLRDFQQYDFGRKFPLARLEYSQVNWSSENTNEIPIDSLQSLKQVVTGDPIGIEPKGRPEYEVAPKCVLMFNINGLPNLKANGEAIRSRYAILRFLKTFKRGADPNNPNEIEADPRFKENPEWLRSAVLPALLNRMLLALQDLIRNGIDYSPASETLNEVQRENSHLAQFCHDTGLDYLQGSEVSVSELWARLELWYLDEGILEISAEGGPSRAGSEGDDFDTSRGKGKRTWADLATPGDKVVKAPNQVLARFLELFPKAKKGVRARQGLNQSRKPEPVIVGLSFPKIQSAISNESDFSEVANEAGIQQEPLSCIPSLPPCIPSSGPLHTQYIPSFETGYASQDASPESVLGIEPPPNIPNIPSLGNTNCHSLPTAFQGELVRMPDEGPNEW